MPGCIHTYTHTQTHTHTHYAVKMPGCIHTHTRTCTHTHTHTLCADNDDPEGKCDDVIDEECVDDLSVRSKGIASLYAPDAVLLATVSPKVCVCVCVCTAVFMFCKHLCVVTSLIAFALTHSE
jgi:hypothetical protein